MATSPLDPSNLSGSRDRSIDRGHGTRALGPSDSSDSGSDLAAGDANLDADSDRGGTGETAAASGDVVPSDGSDIDADHIEAVPDLEELDKAGITDLEDRGREDDEEEDR